jgi:hypothetical protein
MPKLALVLLVAVCAVPAQAEIFKCVSKTGADAYQNFPCHLDSIGSVQTMEPPKAEASAAGTARPKVGMTAAEVTATWGEPVDRYEDEQAGGRFQIWEYGGGRLVRFNAKRRVVTVQP